MVSKLTLEERILALDLDLIHENTLIMRATLSRDGISMKDLQDLSLRDLCELYEMAGYAPERKAQ
jgi:hypothetical protein